MTDSRVDNDKLSIIINWLAILLYISCTLHSNLNWKTEFSSVSPGRFVLSHTSFHILSNSLFTIMLPFDTYKPEPDSIVK
jgi:hypothetical protein